MAVDSLWGRTPPFPLQLHICLQEPRAKDMFVISRVEHGATPAWREVGFAGEGDGEELLDAGAADG